MPATTGDPSLRAALAAEMKARRLKLGISQEELAFRSDINRTYVAKLELAQNQPSLGVFIALSIGLEVDAPELLDRTMKRYAKERRVARRSD